MSAALTVSTLSDADIRAVVEATGCDTASAGVALQALAARGWRAPAQPAIPGDGAANELVPPGDGDLEVYADGACSGNPGPGGWAAIMVRDGAAIAEFSGGLPHTTSNRMELTAILEAVRRAPPDAALEVVTDSRNAIGWLSGGWKRNNADVARLCGAIDQLTSARAGTCSFRHVKGHAGDVFNERADRLAVKARDAARSR